MSNELESMFFSLILKAYIDYDVGPTCLKISFIMWIRNSIMSSLQLKIL